jgi:hypothetical protein
MSAHITCHQGEDYRHLDIQVQGDLDGSSASELANLIVGRFRGQGTVRVDTGSVRSIHPFGVAVLQGRLAAARLPLERLIFRGDKAAEIAPRGCCVERGGCGCSGNCAQCLCRERGSEVADGSPQ